MMKNIKSIYNNFKRKFSKEHLHLMKVAWNSHNYDSCFLLQIEQAKLKEMCKYFKETDFVESSQRTARHINICANLISIINGDIDIVDYDKYFGTDITEIPVRGDGFKKALEHAEHLRKTHNYSYLNRPVNTKNIGFWCSDIDNSLKQYYENNPEEFYKLKAEKLYYKIRQYETSTWWD